MSQNKEANGSSKSTRYWATYLFWGKGKMFGLVYAPPGSSHHLPLENFLSISLPKWWFLCDHTYLRTGSWANWGHCCWTLSSHISELRIELLMIECSPWQKHFHLLVTSGDKVNLRKAWRGRRGAVDSHLTSAFSALNHPFLSSM